MREKGKKKDGQRNVLPPQIFNGEECRGNFEDFDIANEDDLLEEFLGIPRKNPKAVLQRIKITSWYHLYIFGRKADGPFYLVMKYALLPYVLALINQKTDTLLNKMFLQTYI